MRILILVHGYPPAQTGGAERRAARTARMLGQRGHEVRVIGVGSVVDAPDEVQNVETVEDGVRVRRIDLLADRTSQAFETSYNNPQTGAAVEEAILAFAPDVVHLFSGYKMSASVPRAAFRHDIPVVVSLTDYWWMCHRITLTRTNGERCNGPSASECARCEAETRRRFRVPAKISRPLVDALWETAGNHDRLGNVLGLPAQRERRDMLVSVLNECSALISPSQYLADFYVRYGIDGQLLRVWRQGVNIDRCPLRSRSRTLRFGFLGQVKSHKGVDLLLDAWRGLSGDQSRHLYLYGSSAGEPDYGNAMRAAVDQLDDVSWPGEFRGDEVWDILKDLDVIVVPSRWVENSPNSILEAQAMGLPAVAANLGAMPELVVDGQNGLLFEPDDAADLSRQLQRLIDSPEMVDELRSRPIPFKDVHQEIDQLCELYAELVQSGAHKTPASPQAPVAALPAKN